MTREEILNYRLGNKPEQLQVQTAELVREQAYQQAVTNSLLEQILNIQRQTNTVLQTITSKALGTSGS